MRNRHVQEHPEQGLIGDRGARRVREQGSSSVLAAGGVAAMGLVLMGALQLAGAVASEHRAQAAADLAALAGALSWPEGASQATACAVAARIAATNGASQKRCRVGVDGSLLVTTERALPLGLATIVRDGAQGVARAGPGP